MAQILIVDDEVPILNLIREAFEGAGHAVLPVNDPFAVPPLLSRGLPDAMVLDVMMPGMSGWQLLEAVRTDVRTRSLPVLMLSACSDVDSRVRGLREGADDYLAKPFEVSELLARVEGMIARRQGDAASLAGRFEVHPLPDLLQSLDQGLKTGTLEVETAEASGILILDQGGLVGAEYAGLVGPEALLALFEKSEGSYRFRSATPTGERAAPAESAQLPVQSLLMTAAWLEDELNRSIGLLPSPLQRLRLVAAPEELPRELGGLPVSQVLERIGQVTEEKLLPTLTDLTGAALAAPQRVRLAIVWLMEHGHIVALEPEVGPGDVDVETLDPDAAEAFDFAVRELAQAAMFCGGELEGLVVRLFYSADGWLVAQELLLASAVSTCDWRALAGMLAARRGRLTWSHEVGDISLEVSEDRASEFATRCSGIMLALGGEIANETLVATLETIERGNVPDLGGLLVGTLSDEQRQLLVGPDRRMRWRLVDDAPRDLDALLLMIAEVALSDDEEQSTVQQPTVQQPTETGGTRDDA